MFLTVVVTGVSPNSLGSAIALALSSQSPSLLILASRTRSKLDAIVSDIHAKYPDVRVETVRVDLSDLRSVREAADEIGKLVGEGSVDLLFNNAGINTSRRQLVRMVKGEEVELQFATNHLGPFLLTNLLLPLLLQKSGGSRIVMTSSETHVISPVRFSDMYVFSSVS